MRAAGAGSAVDSAAKRSQLREGSCGAAVAATGCYASITPETAACDSGIAPAQAMHLCLTIRALEGQMPVSEGLPSVGLTRYPAQQSDADWWASVPQLGLTPGAPSVDEEAVSGIRDFRRCGWLRDEFSTRQVSHPRVRAHAALCRG